MVTRKTQFSPFIIGMTVIGLSGMSIAGCATVKVQPPDKPIEINLNVKIEQEVRIRLDNEIEDVLAQNADIF